MCHVRKVVCGEFWYFTTTSFLISIVQVSQTKTHCGAHALLTAKTVRRTGGPSSASLTPTVNGVLALLGLEISFREWYSTVKYWM